MTSIIETTDDSQGALSVDVWQDLARHGKAVMVPAGSTLMEAGNPPKLLIILNSGSAETFVRVAGRPRSLGISRAGKVFGLLFMLAEAPPDMSVTCREECEVTVLSKAVFLDVLRGNPKMYFAIVQVLSSDLASANRVIRKYGHCPTAKTKP
jgi:CRP-like cAMP-binding protein